MCDCGKNCNIPVGPIGPKGDQGDQGVQGSQGVQGLQGIQGEQGLDGDLIPFVWTNIALINGWVVPFGQVAQYSVVNGFIHFRGQISAGAASDPAFTVLNPAGHVAPSISAMISDTGNPLAISAITWTNVGNFFRVPNYNTGNFNWSLDSVPPISIR